MPTNRVWRDRGPGIAKSKALADSGLVILRAHDTWDNWPDVGIRDSWAKYLGFTKLLREGSELRWTAVYEIPPTTLRGLAQQIADRIGPLGEDSVQVMGDAERRVSRPAIGVGCAVPDQEMVEYGADVLVMCYDGASYWSSRERLAGDGCEYHHRRARHVRNARVNESARSSRRPVPRGGIRVDCRASPHLDGEGKCPAMTCRRR